MKTLCEKLTSALTPAAAALASDESPDCRASLAKTSGLLLQALGNDPDAALKARTRKIVLRRWTGPCFRFNTGE